MRKADEHEQLTFAPLADKIAIVLNGPPGVGKDTLAEKFRARHPQFKKLEFKESLYELTAEEFGIPLWMFKERATDRVHKDMLWPGKYMTPREMMIHTSEEVIKPKFGESYFGQRAAQKAVQAGDYWVITDGGFQVEVEALNEYFDHVGIVQLYRQGYDFSSDSRDYIEAPDDAYNFTIDLFDDDIDGGVAELERVMRTLVSYE